MTTIICKPMTEMSPQVRLRSSNVVSSGGSAATSTFGGATITTTTGATLKNVYFAEESFFQQLTAANDSGNTDLTDFPNLTRVGNYTGTDEVILSRGIYKKKLLLNYQTLGGEAVKAATGIDAAETYLRYCYEWLAAKSGTAAVYSGEDRDAGCWLADEDLTGIPYSNSTGGAQRNGVLIADNYLAGAHHWPIAVGATVTFKKADGSDVTRTVIGVSETGVGPGDLRICALSGTNPAGIKVYPVASRWVMGAVSNGASWDIAPQYCAVFINRNRDASFIHECFPEALSYAKKTATIGGVTVTDFLFDARLDAAWPENKLPEFLALSTKRIDPNYGDSGSGILVPVAGGLAAVATFGSPQGAPFLDEAFVNACIASARLDAIERGTTPPLQTVTVAPDPTL